MSNGSNRIALLALCGVIACGGGAFAQSTLNPNPPGLTGAAPDLTPPQAGGSQQKLTPVQPGTRPAKPAAPVARSGTDPILTPEKSGEEELLKTRPGTVGDIVDCQLGGGRTLRTSRLECARLGGAS